MRKITNYIRTCGLTNSYDIIKQYDSINKYALAEDIIILFDSNAENILRYVKTLKHNENICEILNGLYDNNIVRILFEHDDMQEIIFNNYKTINILTLEKHLPVDNTIKLIFDILSILDDLSQSTSNKTTYPKFRKDELYLLSKYIFTYASDDTILKLLKYYKIVINDDLINYYAFNESWSMKMFEYLMKHGAKPNINTLLCAVEKHMKTDAKTRHLFDLLKQNVNDSINNR